MCGLVFFIAILILFTSLSVRSIVWVLWVQRGNNNVEWTSHFEIWTKIVILHTIVCKINEIIYQPSFNRSHPLSPSLLSTIRAHCYIHKYKHIYVCVVTSAIATISMSLHRLQILSSSYTYYKHKSTIYEYIVVYIGLEIQELKRAAFRCRHTALCRFESSWKIYLLSWLNVIFGILALITINFQSVSTKTDAKLLRLLFIIMLLHIRTHIHTQNET